jgi:aminoglycoside 6'-N-acetyltransferase I
VEAQLRRYADGCDTSPVGYVEGWFVDSDARRGGIGAQLIAAVESWAISQGCLEMASDTQLQNHVSQAAHARVGYGEVERVIRYRKRLSNY